VIPACELEGAVATTELPPASNIFDYVRHWETTTPERVAIGDGERSWTWREWADRIRRAAGAQASFGLLPGDRVAFLDKNNPACLETSLACGLAGTVNAIVNVRLAPEEIAWIINDSGARVLFAGAELAGMVAKISDQLHAVRRVVVVGAGGDYEQWLAGASPEEPAHQASPDDCLMQMYTSGTTGFPKGAMLTHRSMIAHVRAGVPVFGFDADSVALVAMPLFHVSGTTWALQCMAVGGQTIVLRDIVPADVLDQLARDRISHAFFVPAVYQFFLSVPGVRGRDYSSLRCLGYGGSPMPLPLLRECLEVFDAGLFQIYGMTEVSGALCVLGPADHRDTTHPERLRSAGRPMPGNELRIVDPATGHEQPAGAVGEVRVRSPQVMSGYWGRSEATAEALADGWLHSGDAGRLDDDGYLFIEDRVKDMIISGGENVYPAEIERILVEQPGVADVAVIGVPDDRWGEVPKAMVIAEDGATLDTDALLQACRARLAGYKCPKSFDIVTALPRNASGKVLKHELRKPYWEGRETKI
jgi:acyl-CoA synthetase (AMP-forming)/AMP-acid ligase II